jgi:hypothetical protein
MKKLYLLFLLAVSYTAYSQDSGDYTPASKESEAYHDYRVKNTIPPYSLQKIQGLVKQIKSKEGDDDTETEVLAQKIYMTLSLREKFTYHMIHGESYSQNCDAGIITQDEQKKIFANLTDVFGEYHWSERQLNFFKTNRDSVIALMNESIARSGRVGVNYKAVIAEINAREMVPFLIRTYNLEKKDHDILTVLMLLMKNNQYAAFLSSTSYKKLYGDSRNYDSYLVFNTANEELIIQRATGFYNEISQ